MDTTQFNGAFWIAIAGSISAFVVIVVGAFNKSKCTTVECCCFKCIRDTHAEEDIELAQIKNGLKTSFSSPSPVSSLSSPPESVPGTFAVPVGAQV